MSSLPPRPADGHKGTFGTVVVAAGARLMPGAPAVAARAALRAGCGLVRIAGSTARVEPVLAIEPSAIGAPPLGRMVEADCVVAGCGWPATGHDAELAAIWRSSVPLVLDGGGLRALGRRWRALGPRAAPTVLTPHPGEAAALADALGTAADPLAPAQRARAAQELAAASGAIVVLKGPRTLIAGAGRQHANRTGGVALAIPGSGDVLAGVIASFIAQGLDAYAAACLGARIHGLAGDRWTREHGDRGLLARELADGIPAACRSAARVRNPRGRSAG